MGREAGHAERVGEPDLLLQNLQRADELGAPLPRKIHRTVLAMPHALADVEVREFQVARNASVGRVKRDL